MQSVSLRLSYGDSVSEPSEVVQVMEQRSQSQHCGEIDNSIELTSPQPNFPAEPIMRWTWYATWGKKIEL